MPAALLLAAAACHAQSNVEELNPLGTEPRGLRLTSVSLCGGYTSLKTPNGSSLPQGTLPVGADNIVGGEMVIRWVRSGPKGSISATYTPSYSGLVRNSEWSSMNHALSLGVNSKLSQKWSLGIGFDGQAASSSQLLFTPAVMTQITAVNATFEDLAAALLSGTMTNGELAAILTNTPIVQTPSSTLVYGNRVLNLGASASLTYSPSTRLSIHINAGGSRSQYLSDGQDPRSARNSGVLSGTTGENAGFGLSYSLTPRTNIGFETTATRSLSAFQDAYNVSSRLTVGRKMTNWLLLSGYAGAAKMFALRTTTALPGALQSVGGATIGVRRREHAFTLSASRAAADSYALGAGHTDSLAGAWKWHRPASAWTPSLNIGWQRLGGTAALNLDGWQATATLEHALTRQVSIRTSYGFMDSSGQFIGMARDLRMQTVRLELVWEPAKVH
jgi:hypothetical protein